MSASMPASGHSSPHSTPIAAPVTGLSTARAAGSLYNPRYLSLFIAAGTLPCVAVPVIAVPVAASAAWVLLAGIIANYVILVLSGARAPLAMALLVTAVAFFGLRSEQFSARRRIPWVVAGMLLLPVAVAFASGFSALCLLTVLSGDAGDLSGRNILWPYFRAAWSTSPVFGWGVGAARMVIDPDNLLFNRIGTTAPHNEYLRIGMEGGHVGPFLLTALMALWCWRHTRLACRTDRFIMRVLFIAFAIHLIMDNTPIAATASVLFTWVSAVFARAELEAEAPHRALRAT